MQDVAFSLLARTDVLVPIKSLSAYVYQSLRNRVIDSLRSRRPFVPYDESDEEESGGYIAYMLQEEGLDFDREVTRAELRESIFEAIDDLPDDQKAIVVETEMNGRTFRELSEEWGVPLGPFCARNLAPSRRSERSAQGIRTLKKGGTTVKEEKPECVGKRRVGRKVMRVLAYVVLGIIVAALFALVFGFVLKWLWNWLMPDIFGLRQISYGRPSACLFWPSSSSGGSATPIMTATTTCSRGLLPRT